MTNTDTRDIAATISQIKDLQKVGCELVRVAILDQEATDALKLIKEQIDIPLVADIHFDYRLALAALENGVDGLRLNPGNIGSKKKVASVVREARNRRIPIRIGVNAGSLEKNILRKYNGITAESMVESAMEHVRLLEDMDFQDIEVSLKASEVPLMIAAYRLMSEKIDYPFHIGVTEAGTVFSGSIKTAVGIGILLSEGIGDTLRVSLSGDPKQEVRVGYKILSALSLRHRGVEVISCPTCGRCQIDVVKLAEIVEERLQEVTEPIKIAVMGCPVNGPGEAKRADVGIAGGKDFALIFRNGEVIRRVDSKGTLEALLNEIFYTIKLNKGEY
jgi:(E)-4-hydroxy-3-methylbut-2-enyl-diphosphate synthase